MRVTNVNLIKLDCESPIKFGAIEITELYESTRQKVSTRSFVFKLEDRIELARVLRSLSDRILEEEERK